MMCVHITKWSLDVETFVLVLGGLVIVYLVLNSFFLFRLVAMFVVFFSFQIGSNVCSVHS